MCTNRGGFVHMAEVGVAEVGGYKWRWVVLFRVMLLLSLLLCLGLNKKCCWVSLPWFSLAPAPVSAIFPPPGPLLLVLQVVGMGFHCGGWAMALSLLVCRLAGGIGANVRYCDRSELDKATGRCSRLVAEEL